MKLQKTNDLISIHLKQEKIIKEQKNNQDNVNIITQLEIEKKALNDNIKIIQNKYLKNETFIKKLKNDNLITSKKLTSQINDNQQQVNIINNNSYLLK